MVVRWPVEEVAGPATELHAASAEVVAAPCGRQVRLLRATTPAVVLGSTEPATHLAADRLAARGWEAARRRSGGAAVPVGPDLGLWVDVVVPRDDPRWVDDVGRAPWWLGEVWVRALAAVGLAGARVHRGAMVRTPWSDRVCFAGLGPGEVAAGSGAKVVGISQRRTRHGALFQCAVSAGGGAGWHPWPPGPLLDVLDLPPAVREAAAADLAGCALETGTPGDLEAAFLATLNG